MALAAPVVRFPGDARMIRSKTPGGVGLPADC